MISDEKMGGRNSGTWYRWNKKTYVEDVKRLSIQFLKKQGFLNYGFRGRVYWQRGDESAGDISVIGGESLLKLVYRVKGRGEEQWRDVSQSVPVTYTECNYGGKRPWFLCTDCGLRVGVLYGHGDYFLCRHCCGLSYASQSETPLDRQSRKFQKLQGKVCGDRGYPVRAKGQHWKTYERALKEYEEAEYRYNQLFAKEAQKYGMLIGLPGSLD